VCTTILFFGLASLVLLFLEVGLTHCTLLIFTGVADT